MYPQNNYKYEAPTPQTTPKAAADYQGIVISSPLAFNPCRDVTSVLPRKAEWYPGFKEAISQLFKSVLDFLTAFFASITIYRSYRNVSDVSEMLHSSEKSGSMESVMKLLRPYSKQFLDIL